MNVLNKTMDYDDLNYNSTSNEKKSEFKFRKRDDLSSYQGAFDMR